MSELWDVYDRNFNRMEGEVLVRKEPIPDGKYHLVSNVAVKHVDGSYLIMQREPSKIPWGGYWELSAGGSVLKGENAYDGAVRELREETGIQCEKLIELRKYGTDGRHALYVHYLCITDCDKDSVTLQEGETVAYKWVDWEYLEGLKEDEFVSLPMMKSLKEYMK